jgi:hypothetical protein
MPYVPFAGQRAGGVEPCVVDRYADESLSLRQSGIERFPGGFNVQCFTAIPIYRLVPLVHSLGEADFDSMLPLGATYA